MTGLPVPQLFGVKGLDSFDKSKDGKWKEKGEKMCSEEQIGSVFVGSKVCSLDVCSDCEKQGRVW